jgi:hypothetical protein
MQTKVNPCWCRGIGDQMGGNFFDGHDGIRRW